VPGFLQREGKLLNNRVLFEFFFAKLVDNKPVVIINTSYEWHFDAQAGPEARFNRD